MGSNVKKDRLLRNHNRSIKSAVFTYYKKAVTKLSGENNSFEEVSSAVREFESRVMRAARKNVIGCKSASRKVSRLVLKMKTKFDLIVSA